jgi:hypothetical protein
LYPDSKRELWVGPKTAASPDGFMFSEETIALLINGTDLLRMVKAVVKELQRFDVEFRATPGIWAVGDDYGAYEEAVSSRAKPFPYSSSNVVYMSGSTEQLNAICLVYAALSTAGDPRAQISDLPDTHQGRDR